MSLGPCFVMADDGNWYENPIIGVLDKWFICFDEDDDPELVLHTDDDPELVIKNLPFSIIGEGSASMRNVYTKNGYEMRSKDARSYWLEQDGMIPVNMILKHDGCYTERPNREGTYNDYSDE